MNNIGSGFFHFLRMHWLSLLQVHLIFNLLGIVILGPLFGLLLQLLVGLSGNAAVADQEIARLLLSPLGLASAVLLAGIALAIAAMEMGAMLVIALAAHHSLACSPVQASRYAIRRAPGLLQLTLYLTLGVLVRTVPLLLLIGASAWFLLGEHDINYYLTEKPPQYWWALAIAVVAVIVYLWFVGRQLLRWCLSLPKVLFAELSGRAALSSSEITVAGNLMLVLRAYALCIVVAVLIALIPYVLFDFLGGSFVSATHSRLGPLLFVLAVLLATWIVINFFVAALAVSSVAFVTVELYAHFRVMDGVGRLAEALRLPGQVKHGRGTGGIILVVSLLAAVGLYAGSRLLDIVQREDAVSIVAHRGAAGAAPENTMASIRQALDDGTDWVEIDVQESRDGQIVVFHDSDFMKLSGDPLKIWDGDLEDIQQRDIGSWYSAAFAAERVPTLQQVLEEVRGRARLMIELKYYGHDQALEQRVIDIVEAANMVDEISIMSLKLEGVQKLRALRPDWPVGLLAASAVGDLSRVDVDFLALSARIVTAPLIRRVHKSGKRILVWTVNDAPSMSRWMSMGVDGVITDEPLLAREVLRERAAMSTAERLLVSAALFLGKPVPPNTYRDNSP